MTPSSRRWAIDASAKIPIQLGYGDKVAEFWVLEAQTPVPDERNSGLHICFTASTREGVNRFHAAGLRHGGRDNGEPGPRPDYGQNYYAAFLKDPDGYRVEAYCSAVPGRSSRGKRPFAM